MTAASPSDSLSLQETKWSKNMCLAIPMKLIETGTDHSGKVEAGGVVYSVNLSLLPDVKVGDYVIIHAGFAIERLDEEEAGKTLELFSEMQDNDQ
jgi:hydrogenase expression/formation protein HypC